MGQIVAAGATVHAPQFFTRPPTEDPAERYSSTRDNGSVPQGTVVEMGGIEPPSIAVSLRLLRAQSVQTFYSAPTFVTDT